MRHVMSSCHEMLTQCALLHDSNEQEWVEQEWVHGACRYQLL